MNTELVHDIEELLHSSSYGEVDIMPLIHKYTQGMTESEPKIKG